MYIQSYTYVCVHEWVHIYGMRNPDIYEPQEMPVTKLEHFQTCRILIRQCGPS